MSDYDSLPPPTSKPEDLPPPVDLNPLPLLPSTLEGVSLQRELERESHRFRLGAVAFLDILGTKAIHADAALHEEVERRKKVLGDFSADPSVAGWTWIVQLVKSLGRMKGDKIPPEEEFHKHAFAFSDSVVVTAWRGASPEEVVEWVAGQLALPILTAMRAGVFLRGAISYGQFYSDDSNIVLGPAAVDAHEWSESADWIGVHLTPTAMYAWETSSAIGGDEPPVVRRCRVPLKSGALDLAAVDWARKSRKDAAALNALRSELMRVFSTRPIGPRDEPKFRNTLAFLGEPDLPPV